MYKTLIVLLIFLFAFPERGQTCSYCNPNFQQRLTLRQQAKLAKFIVYGTLANARLEGEKGATDFQIEQIVQSHESLGNRKQLVIPQYIPGGNAKEPLRYLLFGEFNNGKLVIDHGRQVQSAAAANYLKAALAIDDADRNAVLQFCFKHLESAEPEVAEDAFHEFAKAGDQEIAQLSRRLSPEIIRRLLTNPKTPADRLGIFAYLLGACGAKDDADLFVGLIRKNDERSNAALSGLLGGLVELEPERGWNAVRTILKSPDRPFADKLAALGTLRFFHASRPNENRKEIAACLALIVQIGDMADMAIEDLRRWHWWELTPLVLAQYGKPTHAAPLVKRAIVRYALCCPELEAVAFVKATRLADPKIVEQVEESLEFEKPIPAKKNP